MEMNFITVRVQSKPKTMTNKSINDKQEKFIFKEKET